MTSAVQDLLRWSSGRIPPNEARLILAHVMGLPLGRLLLAPDPSPAQVDSYAALVAARATGTPVQYLTGRAGFRTVELAVGRGVFIPRPETEVMTGWILDRMRELPAPPCVVELCAGSGAISLALAREGVPADLHAVELGEAAFEYADANLRGTGVDLRQGDMAEAFADLDGQVDLVVANPPYIPLEFWASIPGEVRDHEPELALFSGEDGLDAIRVVAAVAARLLRPGGWVAVEHAEVQAESAPGIFVRHGGFDQVLDRPDLNDRPRFVTARRRRQVAG